MPENEPPAVIWAKSEGRLWDRAVSSVTVPGPKVCPFGPSIIMEWVSGLWLGSLSSVVGR